MLQRGVVVISKSVNNDRVAQNLDVFELTDDEMAGIATLDTGQTAFFDHHDAEQVARLDSLRRAT